MLLQEETVPSDLLWESPHREFVPVVFARDRSEAELYRSILEWVAIPTLIEDVRDASRLSWAVRGAVPVLVPEHLHDTASDLIAKLEGDPEAEFDDDYYDDDDDLDDDDDDDDDLDDDDDDDDDFEEELD